MSLIDRPYNAHNVTFIYKKLFYHLHIIFLNHTFSRKMLEYCSTDKKTLELLPD